MVEVVAGFVTQPDCHSGSLSYLSRVLPETRYYRDTRQRDRREAIVRNDINRQWLLVRRPEGMVGEDNFRLVEGQIPAPADGEVLVRNLWLSFDPNQRGWMSTDTYVPRIPLGEVMRAASVGQVVE